MMWQYTQRETKALLLSTLLVFSGYGFMLAQDWQQVRNGMDATEQVATSVGVLAAVPDNEVNTLVQQLRNREAELAEREEAFAQARAQTDTKTLALITIIGLSLLGLILLNFYLDMRRRHSLA